MTVTTTPTIVPVEVSPGSAIGSPRTITGTIDPAAPLYTMRVVTRGGAVLANMPFANPKTITKTLNDADEVSFDVAKVDAGLGSVELLSREVQVFRGGKLMSWCVPLGCQRSSGAGAVPFSASGLWWYFKRAFFGTADRENMVPNGDFEQGANDGSPSSPIPGWTSAGTTSYPYSTGTKPAGHGLPNPLTGVTAVALSTASGGGDTYMATHWSYRTEWPPGQLVTFAAWVYLAAYSSPAGYDLGLYARFVVGGKVLTHCLAEIDDDTPRGEWVRLECAMVVPPYLNGYIEVRCYGPGGWVAWDSVASVLKESTSSVIGGDDIAQMAGRIVRYRQNGRGKLSVNVGTYTPSSGTTLFRAWQHADHEWISGAVEDIAKLEGGFDFDIEVTPSTRTFVTYSPQKGADRTGSVTLALGRPGVGAISAYSHNVDASPTTTALVTRAPGDGPDREEGAAFAVDAYGGLVLEDVVDAPDRLPLGDLDRYAAEVLDSRDAPVEVLTATLHPGLLVDVLETGDRVTADISDGWVVVNGTWRIVKLALDCPADTLTLTLNRWTG